MAALYSQERGISPIEGKIFSVSEVNQLIKGMLDEEPALSEILIRGEISNYKLYPSGHHYFTLKDAEGALRCVMFRGQAARLRFRPENGMKVIAAGRISVFPRDGVYQLYCSALSADGVGDLHVAFEQLKEKLFQEGLFDRTHKKPLPLFPRRIAIITSSAGAAVHDMIRIIRRRYPLTKVILLPVRVQGAEAPPEIVGAIRYANRYEVGDVIITGRGGGSIEDLWAFNDERVARAIYASHIPVISAVGHEPDVTIADFVADVRAATPSHAAEIVVPDGEELLDKLRSAQLHLVRAEQKKLALLGERLRALGGKRVLTNPMAFVEDKRMVLDYTQRALSLAGAGLLTTPKRRLGALAASLDAMSPLKVLSRGYAMVADGRGNVVRSVRELSKGEMLSVTMGDGVARCQVMDTAEEELLNG